MPCCERETHSPLDWSVCTNAEYSRALYEYTKISFEARTLSDFRGVALASPDVAHRHAAKLRLAVIDTVG